MREGAVYLLAGTLSRVVSLALLPLYTRKLDEAEVGAFGVITALLLFLQIMTIGGLDSATTRWYFEEATPEQRRRTFATWTTSQLATSAIVALVLASAADPLAGVLTGDSGRFAHALRIAGLTLVTGALPNILFNWFRLARQPIAAGLTALGTTVLTVGATAFVLVGGHGGVAGVFGAQCFSGIVMSAIAFIAMRAAASPTAFSGRRLREMARFALPLIPGGAAFWVIGVADRFLLRAFSSVSEAGRYHVVATISSGLALLTQAFQQTWTPVALEMKDEPRAVHTYRAALVVFIALGSAVTIAVAATGTTILRVVAGGDYTDLPAELTLLTASVVASGALGIVTVGATIAGTSRPVFDGVIVAAVINTAANFALIPSWGALGASVATLVAMAALTAVALFRSEAAYRVGYPLGVVVCLIVIGGTGTTLQLLVSTRTAGASRVVWSVVIVTAVLVGLGGLVRSEVGASRWRWGASSAGNESASV